MELRLNDISQTFVTRERARDVINGLPPDGGTIRVDVSGASLSPSFAAELLTGLTTRFMQVDIIGTNESTAALLGSLSKKLGLGGRVIVSEGVALAG